MTIQLDATLSERWHRDGDIWRAELPNGWTQGRSVFGGLTCAMIVALGRSEAAGRALRTLTLHLVRPIAPGAVEGHVALIRAGRNVSFVEVRLSQEGKATASATLVFAEPNPDMLRIPGAPPPVGAPVEGLQTMVSQPGRLPEFIQHVEMRWDTGQQPFTGAADGDFTGYCRFRVPSGGAEGLVALIDVWPAPPLSMLTGPAPASTVSWTAHLLHVPDTLSDWCYYTYRTVAGEGGYHTCAGHLYDAQGTLLAYSEQLVALYG